MKPAPGRRIQGARDFTLNACLGSRLRRVRPRNGIEQRLGIRMLWIGKHRVALTRFDNLAQIHDADMVADVLHQGEVVGNDEISE